MQTMNHNDHSNNFYAQAACNQSYRRQSAPMGNVESVLSTSTQHTGQHLTSMDDYLYPASGKPTNLIVNYLPSEMDQDEFKAFFAAVGEIESAALMKNDDGTSRCFGFVKYFESADAELALGTFDGYVLQGKKLKIRFARPGGSRAKCKLFVGNLPVFWTDMHLKYTFEEFGEILELKVLRNDDGRSRRCGFVRYDMHHSAQRAIQARNGWTPSRASSPLRVHVAHPNARKQSKRVFMKNGSCVTLHHQTTLVTANRIDDTDNYTPTHGHNSRSKSQSSRSSWSPPRENMPFQSRHARYREHSPRDTSYSPPTDRWSPSRETRTREQYSSASSQRNSPPGARYRERSPTSYGPHSDREAMYMWNQMNYMPKEMVDKIISAYGNLEDMNFHNDTIDCTATYVSGSNAEDAFRGRNSRSFLDQRILLK